MAASKANQFLQKHRGHLILFVLSALITATCIGTMWRHYTHNDPEGFIAVLENRLLDLRFRLRGNVKPSGKVGVLAIDEKSLQKFGRWPFARKHYERVFQNLKALGANWVGMDVVWSEPERPLLEDVGLNITRMQSYNAKGFGKVAAELREIAAVMKAAPGDRSLVRALQTYKKIVMGYAYYGTKDEGEQLGKDPFRGLKPMLNSAIAAVILPDGMELKHFLQFKSYGIIANTPTIASGGEQFAFFNNELSADGVYRWVQLLRVVDGNLMPAMGLKMAANALGREPVVFFDQFGVTDISLVNPNDDKDLLKIPIDPSGAGRMLINHMGGRQTIEHFSFADVFDMSLSDAQRRRMKGMNLLLGPTAIGINDLRANPFDAGFDGVEQHATIIDNILNANFMRRTESIYVTELSILVCIFLLFAPLMIFGKALLSGASIIVFLVAYYYFDKFHWFGHNQWVYMGMPVIEISSLFIGTTLYKYMTEERERKKVKGAFSMYLSPDVINKVLDDPEALKLGGDRKELTVFFSDVRGFTTISESLTPEQLCELMNDYFTPMTSIILRSGGVLDKYIGDAIMAFWGAPLPVANHAEVAALSAVQMLYALDKLRIDLPKKGFPPVDIGIGLNTGLMSVGNMGSGERFCYTVMGDSVNLGSRLESLTKEYGIKIMISEATRKQLKRPDLIVRDLDDIRVKGKLEPVNVFELMRPDYLKSEQHVRSLVGEFEAGRACYRQQDWPKAKQHFMSCLALKPDDGPASLYLERIAEQELAGKIPDWDGVYTFKHK